MLCPGVGTVEQVVPLHLQSSWEVDFLAPEDQTGSFMDVRSDVKAQGPTASQLVQQVALDRP